MLQVTLLGSTLYLHRDATHRSIDLHPVLRHFFRGWIWLTSSMLTREWVAVHRKRHAFADRAGDPHSPVNEGLGKILLEGTEFYRCEARNPLTQDHYGKGTQDDWIERNLYSRHRNAGIIAFVLIELALFGVPGIILIALQMLSMPVLAAGAINGLGHGVGYRNYEVENAATNIVPWGMLICGEELHNNHHAFPASPKFSVRAWEFDAGWLFAVLLESVGLAKIKRTAIPSGVLTLAKWPDTGMIDPKTVYEVVRHRMQVLRAYAKQVTAPVVEQALVRQYRQPKKLRLPEAPRSKRPGARALRKLLTRSPALLDSPAKKRLQNLLAAYPALNIVHDYQEQLRQLWDTIYPARDNLPEMFTGWCARAEASGIRSLEDFAAALRLFSSTAARQR